MRAWQGAKAGPRGVAHLLELPGKAIELFPKTVILTINHALLRCRDERGLHGARRPEWAGTQLRCGARGAPRAGAAATSLCARGAPSTEVDNKRTLSG